MKRRERKSEIVTERKRERKKKEWYKKLSNSKKSIKCV